MRLHFSTIFIFATMTSSAHAASFITAYDAVPESLDTSTAAISNVSFSLQNNDIVRAARSDAASFVASEGSIRSVTLERAFQVIRLQTTFFAQASDRELAKAILVQGR
ncbi:DUF2388 domain-containing protein [Pseudomonas sp. NPDC098747]|uniref:DUF2388 domain-containing protein n=1 Tax=Pseudomonas sp. NPDC098747 TaxID=3364487 RepID=UPI00383A0867